jgi:hypothetical protein
VLIFVSICAAIYAVVCLGLNVVVDPNFTADFMSVAVSGLIEC